MQENKRGCFVNTLTTQNLIEFLGRCMVTFFIVHFLYNWCNTSFMTGDDTSLGIRRQAGDMQAAAINPAFIATYDWPSPMVHDVAVDSHSAGDKPPCGWRRRPRRRQTHLSVFNK